MNPTKGDVHVNRPLTNISIAYAQDASMFIADRVFGNVPVSKQSDRYFFYDKGDWLRNSVSLRAPATESSGSGFRIDNTPTYYAPVEAVHKDVDDQLRANQDDPVQLDRDATEWVTQQLLQRRDIKLVDSYLTAGTWKRERSGTSSNPGSSEVLQWDQDGSAPIVDMRADIVNVAEGTGYKPNVALLGAKVWSVLSDHEDFLDRIKYTQGPAIVTPDLLAQVLELDDVVVSWAVSNTGDANQAYYGESETKPGASGDDDISFIFPDDVLICYRNQSPSILKPSAGYIFSWTGYLGASQQGHRIKQFRMEALASDRIEGEMAYDPKVVSADLGAHIRNAIG